jgi:hypothetical protein
MSSKGVPPERRRERLVAMVFGFSTHEICMQVHTCTMHTARGSIKPPGHLWHVMSRDGSGSTLGPSRVAIEFLTTDHDHVGQI